MARSLSAARAEVRTAALAAELLQLGISGGLLVGEAASAVSLGDGLLFRGSDGVGEVLAVGCLTSIPMVSAFAAALLCCAEPSSRGAWPSNLTRTFRVLAALALLEVIFFCITGVFQPSIHALAWPLAVAVCFSRLAVAWSLRYDPPEPGPPAVSRLGKAPRLRSSGKGSVVEKSQQTEVKVKLHFEELDFRDASEEEWREKLLEHFRQDQSISADACANFHIEFAGGRLAAEIAAPEAQQALAILEAPPNPVVLTHQGVTSMASIVVHGKGCGHSVQQKCAAAMTALSQVQQLQAQLLSDYDRVMTSCHQGMKDLGCKVQILEADTAEQQAKVQSLEAKAKLQLRLANSELARSVAPRERESKSPEMSPEAVSAMAKHLVERTRKDLEAQMAVLQHQFGRVSRELESLGRAAAVARAGECDASASSLRKYLVEALVRPSNLEDAQHLALRLLSQALDAATLLSASALAPKADIAKPPVEIFEKYETAQETRRLHEELVTQRLQELLRSSHADAARALQTGEADTSLTLPSPPEAGRKVLPPMPMPPGYADEHPDGPQYQHGSLDGSLGLRGGSRYAGSFHPL